MASLSAFDVTIQGTQLGTPPGTPKGSPARKKGVKKGVSPRRKQKQKPGQRGVKKRNVLKPKRANKSLLASRRENDSVPVPNKKRSTRAANRKPPRTRTSIKRGEVSNAQREIRALINKVSSNFENEEKSVDAHSDASDRRSPESTIAARQLVGDIIKNSGLSDTGSKNGFILRRSGDGKHQASDVALPMPGRVFLNGSVSDSIDAGNVFKQNEIEVNKDEEKLARRAAKLQQDMSDLQERKLRLKLAKLEQKLRKDAKKAMRSLAAETKIVIDEKITDYREKCMVQSDALRAVELDLTKKIEEMVRMKRTVEQQRLRLQDICQVGIEELALSREKDLEQEKRRLSVHIAKSLKKVARQSGWELEMPKA